MVSTIIKEFIDRLGNNGYGFEMVIDSWLVHKGFRPACLFDIPTWLYSSSRRHMGSEFPTIEEQYVEINHLRDIFFDKLNLVIIPYELYLNTTNVSIHFFVVSSNNQELLTYLHQHISQPQQEPTNQEIGQILGYVCPIDSFKDEDYITIDYQIGGVDVLIEYIPFNQLGKTTPHKRFRKSIL